MLGRLGPIMLDAKKIWVTKCFWYGKIFFTNKLFVDLVTGENNVNSYSVQLNLSLACIFEVEFDKKLQRLIWAQMMHLRLYFLWHSRAMIYSNKLKVSFGLKICTSLRLIDWISWEKECCITKEIDWFQTQDILLSLAYVPPQLGKSYTLKSDPI